MTQDTTLANARLVLGTEVVTGHLVLRDGKIAEIGTGAAVPRGALDCGGDYLIPGLIELHTDNLERHISPRPKVPWPHGPAILAHDRELAGCGITTVFDALRVGSIPSGKARYKKYARALATELLDLRARDVLKISHFLHLRAEICSETLADELTEFTPEDRVGIVSLMDHTPGQRQFRDMDKMKAYVMGKNSLNDAEFEEHVARLRGVQARLGAAHEAAGVAACRRLGAVLASHDDTTADQVTTSAGHGVAVAEFPTTVEAAEACRASGIAIIMGAPNLVRGGSHSGNVAARDLAERDLLDILSSDYVPAALLMSGVQLGLLWGDMARGIATVTANPAQHVGLTDRGRLAPGLRADIVRFADLDGVAVARQVWSRGVQVA
ncbi:alpha-D-ribose 1-methylphosphonate 5-triphosphate diphosphatase [uncultured Tateyamaria sp.]|uniref:alpha-D-ribose 1-methylphosphonate 5-triphosphate diphosphatase n=1 Tax=uncultured Tateyamaria sp. TaxID=455651 RepID=UPI0026241E73|nr:alpha-D-ribose 1-methylphosphonate 5-triphosphate diphosphatase [uncultured Tateyamaria sp.]